MLHHPTVGKLYTLLSTSLSQTAPAVTARVL